MTNKNKYYISSSLEETISVSDIPEEYEDEIKQGYFVELTEKELDAFYEAREAYNTQESIVREKANKINELGYA